MNTRHAAIVVAAAVGLAGCGNAVAPEYGKLAKAPARAMVPPKALEAPKKGDDIDAKHIELMQQYDVETGKLRVLQARERTLQGK